MVPPAVRKALLQFFNAVCLTIVNTILQITYINDPIVMVAIRNHGKKLVFNTRKPMIRLTIIKKIISQVLFSDLLVLVIAGL